MAYPNPGGLRAISTQTFSLEPQDSTEYRLRPASFKQPLSYGSKRTRNQANCSQYFTRSPHMSSSLINPSRSMIIDKETTRTLKKSIHRAPGANGPGHSYTTNPITSGRQHAQLETHFINCVQKQMEGRLADVALRQPIHEAESVGSRYSKAREIRFAEDAKFKKSIATLAEDLRFEPLMSQESPQTDFNPDKNQDYDHAEDDYPHRTPEKQSRKHTDGEHHLQSQNLKPDQSRPFPAPHAQMHDEYKAGEDWNSAEDRQVSRSQNNSEMAKYYQRRSKESLKSNQLPTTATRPESTVKHSTVSTLGQLNLNRNSVASNLSWSHSQAQLMQIHSGPYPQEFDPQEPSWEFVRQMETKIDQALARSRSRSQLNHARNPELQEAPLASFQQGPDANEAERERQNKAISNSVKQEQEPAHFGGTGGGANQVPHFSLQSHQQGSLFSHKQHEKARSSGTVWFGERPNSETPERGFSRLQGSDENLLILGSPVGPNNCEVAERYDDPLSGSHTGLARMYVQRGQDTDQSAKQSQANHGTRDTNQTEGYQLRGKQLLTPELHNSKQSVQYTQGTQSHSLISNHSQGLAFRGLAHDINKRNHFVAKHGDIPGTYAYELNSNFLDEIWSLRFVSSQELRVLIADSVVFVGDKKNGVKCGRGKYLTQRGGRVLYEGFFYDNLYHGEGRLVNPKLPTETIFQGWWRDLDRLEHWQQFQGHFSGGYPEGLGTLFTTAGDTISGVFLRGRLNGNATIRFAQNPNKELSGEWLDNILCSELQ